LALDSGVRKKPSVERGPKAISAIKQPKPITKDGVRQPPVGTARAAANSVFFGCVFMSPRQNRKSKTAAA